MRSPWRLVRSLAGFLAYVAAGLVGAELIVRMLVNQNLEPDLYQASDEYTIRLKPNVRGFMHYREYHHQLGTSSMGIRDTEFAMERTPEDFRALMLGDSQTTGFGVEFCETFSQQLEVYLRDRLGRPTQIINSGMPTWGTAHELLLYENEAKAFKPDVVLVQYYLNDLADNTDLFRLDKGVLVEKPIAERHHLRPVKKYVSMLPGYPYFAQHSHLMNWFRAFMTQLFVRDRPEVMGSDSNALSREEMKARQASLPEAYQLDYQIRLQKELLLRFGRSVTANGARFVLLILPSREFVELKQKGLHDEELEKAHDEISALCHSQGWGCVEPGPAILKELAEKGTQIPDYYYLYDFHTRPRTHALVAGLLVEQLEALQLIPPLEPVAAPFAQTQCPRAEGGF